MRKYLIVTVIFLVLVAMGLLAVKHLGSKSEEPVIQTFSTKQNPAFKSVPLRSPLIVEVKNTKEFYNYLKGNHPILAELKKIPEWEQAISELNSFADFIAGHEAVHNLLKGKSIILSVNQSGKNQISNLYLVQLNNATESASALGLIRDELSSDYIISNRTYENTTIMQARSAGSSLFFACSNDVLMLSEDFILLEQAIRQGNSQNLLDKFEFTELYKTIEENAFANIFINHSTIQQFFAKFLTSEIRKSTALLSAYTEWSGLDLTIEPSALVLNGYSMTRDSSDQYLKLFQNQAAQKLTIEKAIPNNASYFVALNLGNTTLYLDQYNKYLRANGIFYPRESILSEFQKKTKTDPRALFKEVGGKQFACVYTGINKSNPGQNRFFVAEISQETVARDKIEKAVSEFESGNKKDLGKIRTDFRVDNKNSFEIFRLPVNNMAESLFGNAFSGVTGNYLVIYKKYLIWGDNLTGMKTYLQSLVSEKTLANDSIYLASAKNNQINPNFYLYSKIPKVFRLKDALLRPEYGSKLSANEDVFAAFSTFTWQFKVVDQMMQNKVQLTYDPNQKEEPQALWQLKLDAPLAGIPKLVKNHKDAANSEIIVTDKLNNLYLVNKDGIILWKIELPEAIVSEIHQLDLYRNNRYQYLFNTKTHLYVIDRMGNNVGKFPTVLKSMASNGVSIAEYGQNKEYRFIVAGEDKKIYVFDRDGKLVPKWNFEGTASLVKKPVLHVSLEEKDYLIFSDRQNTYFLDRQGKSREINPPAFNHSVNPMYFFNSGQAVLISTDQSGKIHIQDFTGQAEIRETGKFNAGHRFVAADLDGNGTPEYLFAEDRKLSVYANDGKKLFEKVFPDEISETPAVVRFGNGITKIGVVTGNENKIYLLEKNGSVMTGFPLEGNTSFAWGKFNETANYYNLLIVNADGMLVNYKIE